MLIMINKGKKKKRRKILFSAKRHATEWMVNSRAKKPKKYLQVLVFRLFSSLALKELERITKESLSIFVSYDFQTVRTLV